MEINEINVVGLGFVGLTTAACFAKKGFKVIAIDNNKSRLDKLKKNIIDFYEPGLKKIYITARNKKNLILSNKFIPKKNVNIILICIGTPSLKNGNFDIVSIKKFISSLTKFKEKEFIVIIKSTILPGTIREISKKISNNSNIRICSNPEFLREGFAVNDFMKPDRVIIGSDDFYSKKVLDNLYANFTGAKIYTNTITAEYIKILSNNLLSNLISFSNFMSFIALGLKNIDIKKAFDAVKKDKRWFGHPANISTYFHPGLGYGGYCLPKDTSALMYLGRALGYNKNIIAENISVNNQLINFYTKKILTLSKSFKKICILGLSFKPGSDDIRDSKSIELANKIKSKTKKEIIYFDPLVKKIPNNRYILKKPIFKNNYFYILSTAWPEYKNFLKDKNKKNYIDLRYCL